MNIFLNEASVPAFHSKPEARTLFEALKASYQPARTCGLREIKIKDSFYKHEFAPDYTFYKWAEDPTVDEDFRTLLKSVIGSTPLADDMFIDYENDNGTALAIKCKDQNVLGLGLASNQLFNTVALSFVKTGWDDPEYDIVISGLEENEHGQIVETEIPGKTKNISLPAHVDQHAAFINEQVARSVSSGKELWLKRTDLFPNLFFCDNVRSQLNSIGNGSIFLPTIIERLFDLQNIATKFDGNPIKPADFPTKTTPESNTRLKADKDLLTILCPDGNNFLFSWHSRYTPGAGRIHFRPYENENRILIGSIANQNSIK